MWMYLKNENNMLCTVAFIIFKMGSNLHIFRLVFCHLGLFIAPKCVKSQNQNIKIYFQIGLLSVTRTSRSVFEARLLNPLRGCSGENAGEERLSQQLQRGRKAKKENVKLKKRRKTDVSPGEMGYASLAG